MKNFPVNLLLDNFPYLVEEIAQTIHANPKTIDRWIRKGLQVLNPKGRPRLILGSAVKSYYRSQKQVAKSSRKAAPGELKCPSCRHLGMVEAGTLVRIDKKQHPSPNFPDYTVSFSGTCTACGKRAYRMESLRTEVRLLECYDLEVTEHGLFPRNICG